MDSIVSSILKAVSDYEKANKTILSQEQKDMVIVQYLKKMGISLVNPDDFDGIYIGPNIDKIGGTNE